jgi:hypothetical protein
VVLNKNSCGECHKSKNFIILRNACAQPQCFHYLACNNPLISIQMLHTMLWAQFSLSMDSPWTIIIRHYHMSFIRTLITKNKCTPFCKPDTHEGITFSRRRQSSTLIISCCSSCRHRENCRMTSIRSGPHTCISSISTSYKRHESPTVSFLASFAYNFHHSSQF